MRIFICIVFYFTVTYNHAQNIDSLYQCLKQSKQDSTRFRIVLKIGEGLSIERIPYWDSLYKDAVNSKLIAYQAHALAKISEVYFYRQNLQRAIKYGNQAFVLFNSIKAESETVDAMNRLMIYYGQSGDYEKQQAMRNVGLHLAKANGLKNQIVKIVMNTGVFYEKQYNFKKAIQHYFEALKLYTEYGILNQSDVIYINISSIYSKLGDNENGLKYALISLNYCSKAQDVKIALSALRQVTEMYQIVEKCDSSLHYGLKVLKLSEKINDKQQKAMICIDIGTIYSDMNKPEIALQYFFKALALDKIRNDYALCRIGKLYLSEKQFAKASVYLNKALILSKKNKNKDVIVFCNILLSELYEKTNQPKKALFHYKESVFIRDGFYNEENKKKIVQAETNYEYEKKALALKLEQEKKLNDINLQAERKNTQNKFIVLGLLSLLVLAGIGTFVLYRNRKQEKRLQQIEQQAINQKLLRLQMNPHFIFNALSTLQNFIYADKKVEAGKYLTKVSKLIRDILETSREEFITLDKEIETLDNYLKVNQTLLANQFDYTITVDETIETDVIEVPLMMIQPFIENALKHGLQNLNKKGSINVYIKLKNKQVLLVDIQDNGLGFVQKKDSSTSASNSNHQSLATTITKERLANILNTSTQKIEINVTELKDEQQNSIGVKTSFEIPYRAKEL